MAGRRASVLVFVSLPVLQGVLGLAGFSLVLGWTRRSDWNQKGISPQNSKSNSEFPNFKLRAQKGFFNNSCLLATR